MSKSQLAMTKVPSRGSILQIFTIITTDIYYHPKVHPTLRDTKILATIGALYVKMTVGVSNGQNVGLSPKSFQVSS